MAVLFTVRKFVTYKIDVKVAMKCNSMMMYKTLQFIFLCELSVTSDASEV